MYDKGFEVGFAGEDEEGVAIFHAGTAKDRGGRLITDGGRVLAVSAVAGTAEEATARAYEAVGKVKCANLSVREDIGCLAE
jgi:phosphoribosylamine--glycine ligase